MHRSYPALRSVALGALLTGLSIGQAFALEAGEVAQRLKEVLAAQSVDLNWTSVTGASDEIVIEGATYGVAGTEEVVNVGRIILANVSEDNGGYLVGTMSLPYVTMNTHGVDFEMTEGTMNGVRIPAAGGSDYLSNMLFYDTGNVERIRYALEGKEIALIENIRSDMTPKDVVPMRYTATVERFTLDTTSAPDQGSRVTAQALGFDKITGSMEMAGSWNMDDGRIEMSKLDTIIDDAGKISVTLDIGGYTPQFLTAFQEMAKKVSEAPRSDDAREAAMPMLAMLQSLVLNRASIRFDDASITGKVLDFIARQQGADPVQLRQQTKTIVPFLLASSPIRDEALKKEIAGAVATYLDDPRNFTVRVNPAAPQPMLAIATMARLDPISLIPMLGLSVSANE